MNKKIGALSIIVLFAISFISAEVFFSQQPREIYNLGGEILITIGTDGEEGWATLELVCDGASRMIFFNFLGENDRSTKISVPLSNKFLRGIMGNCKILLKFNEVEKSSLDFIISDSINVDLRANKKVYNPGEIVEIFGEVSKPNTPVQGSVKVSLSNSNLESVLRIENNKFASAIEIPENMPSGEYTVTAFAYERDSSEEITNSGEEELTISINQRADSITLEMPREVQPGESFDFKVVLTDQAGYSIDSKPLEINIFNTDGEKVFSTLSETGTTNSYNVRKNSLVGYWTVNVSSENLQTSKQILIKEHKEVEFDVINNTLLITNIGNVPYSDFIEVRFNKEISVTELENDFEETEELNESLVEVPTEIIHVVLDIGKSMEFKLSAPDGEYELNIRDASKEISTNAFLTGKSISVGNPEGKMSFFNKSFILWFFVIGVLGLLVFVSSRKVINQKVSFSYRNFGKRDNIGGKGGVIKINPQEVKKDKNEEKSSESQLGGAEHKLVMDGSKQEAMLLTIKLKNKDDLKKIKEVEDIFSSIDRKINESGGRTYKKDNYVVGVFAPAITRTFDNGLRVIKSAKEITEIIAGHNKKYTSKIDFGIGVNSGEIIAKKEKDKLLFASLGLTLSASKKLAEISNKEILLTDSAHKKVLSKIKAVENPEKFGMKSYLFKEIKSEHDSKFIKDFLNRNQDKL